MELPILKYLDVLIGFVLVMILASTVVATITQLGANLTLSREKYLFRGIEELLTQIAPANLTPQDAKELSERVLRHPLIGRPNWLLKLARVVGRILPAQWGVNVVWFRARGSVIKREELIRILLDIATGGTPVAQRLQQAFGFAGGAVDAVNALRAIGDQALKLEHDNPSEAAHIRETRAIIAGTWANALVARINAWYDQSMDRATQSYAFEAKISTAVVSLALVLWVQLDSFDLIRRLSADDKMRGALLQQAERVQEKVTQTQTAPASAPPDEIELLKKQREQIETAVADLNQPNLAILSQFYTATTKPAAFLVSSQYRLAVGTKTFTLPRAGKEGFTVLADRINALNAGVRAAVNVGQRNKEQRYTIALECRLPSINTLELRRDPNGVNLVARVRPLYSQSAEATTGPLAKLEPGPYRLNVGHKVYDFAVQENQTFTDLMKAINEHNAEVHASTADSDACTGCSILTLTAKVPDPRNVQLRTEAGKTNLIQKIEFEDRTRTSIATTDPAPLPKSRDFRLVIGSAQYDVNLAAQDGFPELADKLNALRSDYVKADVTNVSTGACQDCYVLRLRVHVPDVNDIGLRAHHGGVNMVDSVERYYPWWNLEKAWPGIILSWILLSLGTPFWYDALKNLLRLRPLMAKQEEKDRQDRQTTRQN